MTLIDVPVLHQWLAERTPDALHPTDTHESPVYERAAAYQDIDGYLRTLAGEHHQRGTDLRPVENLIAVTLRRTDLERWLRDRANTIKTPTWRMAYEHPTDRRRAYLDLADDLDRFVFDPIYAEAFPYAPHRPALAERLAVVVRAVRDLVR